MAFQVGDDFIGLLALAGIGAILGFFIWNFPTGLIFLGDGGAYFLGFLVAELSILLLVGLLLSRPLLRLLSPAHIRVVILWWAGLGGVAALGRVLAG